MTAGRPSVRPADDSDPTEPDLFDLDDNRMRQVVYSPWDKRLHRLPLEVWGLVQAAGWGQTPCGRQVDRQQLNLAVPYPGEAECCEVCWKFRTSAEEQPGS